MSAKIDFAVVIHSGVAQVTFSIALDNNAFATIFVENILERERSEIKKRRKNNLIIPYCFAPFLYANSLNMMNARYV